jgi:hypothetical protein
MRGYTDKSRSAIKIEVLAIGIVHFRVLKDFKPLVQLLGDVLWSTLAYKFQRLQYNDLLINILISKYFTYP